MLKPTPRPQPKKRPRYGLRRLMVLLLLLSPFLVWWSWSTWRHLPLKSEGTAPRVAEGPVYVAILGVDERTNDVGRSDTLMLLRLDPASNRLQVINVPRDTRITYQSGKQSKINAAFSIGGADLTTQVLQTLLDVERPYYLKLNFQAFEEIVDQLGGIDLNIEKHYHYEDPYQKLLIDLPAGQQHLNGEQALKYVRLRYDGVTNSDIARIERQQKFLTALKEKLSSPYYWPRLPGLVATMRKYVATNVPEEDQIKLAQGLYKARENVQLLTLPGTPDDKSGDWLFDQAKWKEVTDGWTR